MSTAHLERLRAISEARRAAYALVRSGQPAANQPISQPINQTISQPINQTISHPINQPISHPISHPTEQQSLQVILQQIRDFHNVILPDGKTEVVNATDLYVYQNTRLIYDKIKELNQIIQTLDIIQQENQKTKYIYYYLQVIKKLTELVNFIYNLNEMPRLRRIYQCGELIHVLHNIPTKFHTLIDLQNFMKKIKLIINYLAFFTVVLTQQTHIIAPMILAHSNQLTTVIQSLAQ